ncbi:TetR/AcrR family transcriptional regulator [Sphingobacterium chungjuense]|uniref:TetR/AcrR family transcriptional regulator n=1 Tax=Sphingobacterium chungjuense TaxID=2675553 RepID=UPI00140C3740|nr:TetR/AcrR family transcriptional regulator [Sphingobacterium chungjuense]
MMKRKRSTITKAKMLKGIHDILIEEGWGKVNVAYVSSYSGIDRKLLYYHFESFSNMVAEFLSLESVQFKEGSVDSQDDQELTGYLKQRMETLFENPLLKQLLVWELSAKMPALKEYAAPREEKDAKMSVKFNDFEHNAESDTDMQAVFALLLGGIHYLSAYSHHNDKPFFGMNFNDEQQRKHLLNLLDKLLLDVKQMV